MDYSEGHARLAHIAASLRAGVQIKSATVRDLLHWFGAEYRGTYINEIIRTALFQYDLRTAPDLGAQSIDGTIEYCNGIVLDEIEKQFFAQPREFHAKPNC